MTPRQKTAAAAAAVLLVAALVGGLLLWPRADPPSSAPPGPPPEAGLAERGSQEAGAPPDPARASAGGAAEGGGAAEAEAEAAAAASTLEAELRAELALWQEAGVVHAVCPLDPPLAAAEGYLSVGDPEDFNGRRVIVLDGQAYLPELEGHPTDGHLSVEGYAPAPVGWDLPEGEEGRCRAGAVALKAGGAVITGRVRHAGTEEGAPGAWVEGCGSLGMTDDEGVYYLEALAGTPCTLIAMRQDGKLRTISPPQSALPVADQDVVVDFELPAQRKAGLGVQIRPVEEGLLVEGIIPGGSAERAGLAAGDVILAIDGEEIAGMDLGEVVEMLGGEEGSEVALTLAGAGEGADAEDREVVLERAVIN